MGVGRFVNRRLSSQYLHGYGSRGSRCGIAFTALALGQASAAACFYRLGAMGNAAIERARRDNVRYP